MLFRSAVPGVEPARRYYLLVPFSTRNRPGPPSAVTEVQLPPLPAPPAGIEAVANATDIVLTWAPLVDAPAGAATEPATVRFNVYADQTAQARPVNERPVPLNSMPLERATFSEPVSFGRERCYRVRTIRGDGAMAIEGEQIGRAHV